MRKLTPAERAAKKLSKETVVVAVSEPVEIKEKPAKKKKEESPVVEEVPAEVTPEPAPEVVAEVVAEEIPAEKVEEAPEA